MAAKGIPAEQNHIRREHQRAHADAEPLPAGTGSSNHIAFQTSYASKTRKSIAR